MVIKKVIYLLTIMTFVLAAATAYADSSSDKNQSVSQEQVISHSGGTDQYGCHTNHKTGVYHCH